MKLISWNVNGIRAVLKKGFRDFIDAEQADIVCLQETKAHPDDVPDSWHGYEAHWNWAEKKGYAGTLILTKTSPLSVSRGIGTAEHDREGRVLTAEYTDFFLVNVYVPNSKRDLTRLTYRQQWDRDFLAYLRRLESTKPVVFCGDLNVAHTEIDLANPRSNAKNSGFLPEERAWFSKLLEQGWVDSVRALHPGEKNLYSWWSNRGQARKKDVGWRLDYVLCSPALAPRVKRAWIEKKAGLSDHAPVCVEIEDV